MIESRHLNTLRKLYALLEDCQITWVVTGSLGMALQGMDIEVHDIDLQTDKNGAYEMERLFSKYVVKPVTFSASERICSHFGILELDGVKVEIMGDIQKRQNGQEWEKPIHLECYRQWIEIQGMQIPVLALEYEYQAYLKLGRFEKAEMLRTWLQKQKAG
jgi:hypothetical protein